MEQILQKGAQTDKKSKRMQEGTIGKAVPQCQKFGTVWPCHLARLCTTSSLACSLDFLFEAPSGAL